MTGIQVGSVTVRRRAPAALITMALLAGAVACGQAAPAPRGGASSSAAASSPGTVALAGSVSAHDALTVLSVSFATPSVGWLLATPCADHAQRCRTVVMRKTVDGGKTWFAVPAPSAPLAIRYQGTAPAGAVGSIVFASARDGWAFGPALWQTRDGGSTWRKVSAPGGPVQDLAVTEDRALAVTGRCGTGGSPCSFRVWTAAAGAGDWRAISGASGSGVSAARLATSGGVGYVFAITSAGTGRPLLLGGPVNGAGRWRALADPCGGAWSGALAAAPGGRLFLGCGGIPGAGEQLKHAWVSADSGHSWQQAAGPPAAGYLGEASMNAAGTVFLSGGRMDLYISWDSGRSWHESPSLKNAADLAGAGFALTGMTITGTCGFAVQDGANRQQIWLTADGGHHWTPVTVR